MEHLSPGSNVMMTFGERYPQRHAFTSGIACAAAVGHDCGSLVGQAVALGAAHALSKMTSASMTAKVKNCLWFILFTSFRFLNRCKIFYGFAPTLALAFPVITIAHRRLTSLPFLDKIPKKQEFVLCYL
jgi:hypothetical protein